MLQSSHSLPPRDSATMASIEVERKRGTLKKKSPKGLKGLHVWQARVFVLTDEELRYYDEALDVLKGTVRLRDVTKAQPHMTEDRIDLVLFNGKLVQLKADTQQLRNEWLQAIQASALHHLLPSLT